MQHNLHNDPATAVHQQEDRDEQAWALLLQSPALADPDLVCRLLCVSRAMLEAVHLHLAGQLEVAVSKECRSGSSKHTSSMRPWLARHGSLLRSLAFRQLSGLECSRPEQQQQIAQIAAGLKEAAATATAGQLRLTSLASNVCAKVLLEALPPNLTRLELGPSCTDELQKHLSAAAAAAARSPSPSPSASSCSSSTIFPTDSITLPAVAAVQPPPTDSAGQQQGSAGQPPSSSRQSQQAAAAVPCGAVLASLPVLGQVVLHGYAANALLCWLQPCTQLRSLTLCNLLCPKVQLLHSLPAQLQELHVSVDPDFTSWQRKQRQPSLAHLTALTSLSCTGEGLFAVQADEVLPPNLVRLVVSDCPRAAPLLALGGLQALAMQASTMDAAQLAQLRASLPRLTELQLGYDRGNMDAITAAAPGWPVLAGVLRGLDLRVYPGPLPAASLGHLGQLGAGLTRLAISGFSVQVEATPATFAATLACLPGLQELKLAYLRFKDQPVLAEAPLSPPVPAPAAAAAGGTAAGSAAAEGGETEGSLGRRLGQSAAAAAAAPAGPEGIEEGERGKAARGAVPHVGGLVVLMQQVAALPVLTNLSLHSMVLTGAPVAALAAVGGRLRALQLNECDLCDADVALLAGSVTRLRKLALNWNFGVKSEGLRALSGLRGLGELHVCCGTSRHEAALAELQAHLPGLVAVS